MNTSNEFTQQLEKALFAKIDYMNGTELKALRDEFKLFQSAFQGIYNVLQKKGIIHDDPYKYELKISDVMTPPESPFTESEKIDQISIRMSQFESYVDFLNNYFQFSVEFLTMGRIKKLVALTKYFVFTQFTETSPHLNTRYLAELVSSVRKGSDPLSVGILNEGLLQLDKASRKIFQTLKELTVLHKEQYKLDLRLTCMKESNFEPTWAVTHREEAIRKVKGRFGDSTAEHPFYAELVEEILLEDYSSEGQSLRDEVLKKLSSVMEDSNKKVAVEHNFKNMLLDAIHIVSGVAFQLEDAISKLNDNQATLDSMDKSFMTKLKRALDEMFKKNTKPIMHEVEYLDAITSERKSDMLNFTVFMEEAARRAQTLMSVATRTSTGYKRLESASEEQAFKFLEKALEDLQSFFRKMTALDEFFKDTMTEPEIRNKVRSIKVELGSLKNTIIKANQKKHEYIDLKEEKEQMKRLGIKE